MPITVRTHTQVAKVKARTKLAIQARCIEGVARRGVWAWVAMTKRGRHVVAVSCVTYGRRWLAERGAQRAYPDAKLVA
jgi:hypothetical protein